MSKNIALALVAGIVSALAFSPLISESLLAIVVGPFSILPLFLIGLSAGAASSAIAGASGLALIIIMGGGVAWTIIYMVANALPAVALSGYALAGRGSNTQRPTRRKSGPVIGLATGYVCALFIVLELVFAGHPGGLSGEIARMVSRGISTLFQTPSDIARQNIATIAQSIAYVAPGFMLAWWLTSLVLSFGIAQSVLVKANRLLRSPLDLRRAVKAAWDVGVRRD